jgi:hypothetical protein
MARLGRELERKNVAVIRDERLAAAALARG